MSAMCRSMFISFYYLFSLKYNSIQFQASCGFEQTPFEATVVLVEWQRTFILKDQCRRNATTTQQEEKST